MEPPKSFNEAAHIVADEIASLLERKNRDYGTDNITLFKELGILVRSSDKVARLRTLLWTEHRESGVADEKIEDTWRDLAGYSIIATVLRQGWDGKRFGEDVHKIASGIADLLIKKNNDYGSNNVLAFGEVGVLVRVNDKIMRLKNLLYDNPQRTIANADEKIVDTWRDIAGYAIVAMLLKRRWFELPLEMKDHEAARDGPGTATVTVFDEGGRCGRCGHGNLWHHGTSEGYLEPVCEQCNPGPYGVHRTPAPPHAKSEARNE